MKSFHDVGMRCVAFSLRAFLLRAIVSERKWRTLRVPISDEQDYCELNYAMKDIFFHPQLIILDLIPNVRFLLFLLIF